MLQSWSEQPSSSSGVWHSFPQPVAGQLSETQLYFELLLAPKRDEEGREEGRRKGRRKGRKGRKKREGRRRGRGEESMVPDTVSEMKHTCTCTLVLQNPYNTQVKTVPLSCSQSHWLRLQGWSCLGLRLPPASSSAQCSLPSHPPTLSWLLRAVYGTCDLPLVARGEMKGGEGNERRG